MGDEQRELAQRLMEEHYGLDVTLILDAMPIWGEGYLPVNFDSTRKHEQTGRFWTALVEVGGERSAYWGHGNFEAETLMRMVRCE